MIDLRTFLLLFAVADLVFAAALWLGGGRPLREGLATWATSLLVRALACGVVAAAVPASGALAVGSGLFALSIALQASAVLTLEGRRLDPWIYGAVVTAVALPLQLLEGEAALAAVFGGVVLGT